MVLRADHKVVPGLMDAMVVRKCSRKSFKLVGHGILTSPADTVLKSFRFELRNRPHLLCFIGERSFLLVVGRKLWKKFVLVAHIRFEDPTVADPASEATVSEGINQSEWPNRSQIATS